jgi:hypothetical protein
VHRKFKSIERQSRMRCYGISQSMTDSSEVRSVFLHERVPRRAARGEAQERSGNVIGGTERSDVIV